MLKLRTVIGTMKVKLIQYFTWLFVLLMKLFTNQVTLLKEFIFNPNNARINEENLQPSQLELDYVKFASTQLQVKNYL